MAKGKGLKPPKQKRKIYKQADGKGRFIVVVDGPNRPSLVQEWLSAMYKKREGAADFYYHLSKTGSLIVQVEAGLDIQPILGAHYWQDFLPKIPWVKDRVSYIYEYNYGDHGEPENRSFIQESFPAPRLDQYRYILPYPQPPCYWAGPPVEDRIRQLVKTLPENLPRRPGQSSGDIKPLVKTDGQPKQESLSQADFEWFSGAKLDEESPPDALDVKPEVDIKPKAELGTHDGTGARLTKNEVKSESSVDVKPTVDDFAWHADASTPSKTLAAVKAEADGPSLDDFYQFAGPLSQQLPAGALSSSNVLGKRSPEDVQADQSKRVKTEF